MCPCHVRREKRRQALRYHFIVSACLTIAEDFYATFQSVQDNEMEGSDSNDEEWKSDSSRYVSDISMCSFQHLFNILIKRVLHMKRL